MLKNGQNPLVDNFMINGCMRCKLGATPGCKVHRWKSILDELRAVLSEFGLTEELKWGMPCYTLNGKNILMMAAFKDYCSLSFFKGAMLKDPDNILVKPGENSQAFRYLKFTDPKSVQKNIIKNFIQEAIELEQQGKKITFNKSVEPYPEELITVFEKDPSYKNSFQALTPGRQRGYLLYFSNAVQSTTKTSRILKYRNKILEGKGLQD